MNIRTTSPERVAKKGSTADSAVPASADASAIVAWGVGDTLAVMRARYPLSLLLALAGCNDGDTAAEDLVEVCEPPARVIGELCLEPGVADTGCPAGTLFDQSDGSCRPAGMLASDCAEGFVHDGDVGCEPVLPLEVCAPGLMAVPGDSVCRPVMECGSGKWGDIPVDANTQHVDGSFAGVSDGSAAAPWTSISAAVSATQPGGLIAVAAGSYVENVVVSGKAVRIHGVCPQLVELVGSAQDPIGCAPAALCFAGGADGSEVRGLAISGQAFGLSLSGSQQVVWEQLWIHDTGWRGVLIVGEAGPTSVSLRDSLVESCTEIGIFVAGSELSIERSVVRDTLPDALGDAGRGISVQPDAFGGGSALVTLSNSLLERNRELAVFMQAAEFDLDATVIRDTFPDAQGNLGRGVGIQAHPDTGAPSLANLRRSLVERNHQIGVMVVGSVATIEATTIRDTLPDTLNDLGRGVYMKADPITGTPSRVTLHAAVLQRNHGGGVSLDASEAFIQSTVIRDTTAQGLFGRGVNAQPDFVSGAASMVTLRGSLIERSLDLGLVAYNSVAVVESSAIVTTMPNTQGIFGDGLSAVHAVEGFAPASMVVTASRIEESTRAGLSSFGAFVSLEKSAVTCSAFQLGGESSLGVPFQFDDIGGNACGCPVASDACKVISAGLEPPSSLATTQ
jgi:hypothetical protein